MIFCKHNWEKLDEVKHKETLYIIDRQTYNESYWHYEIVDKTTNVYTCKKCWKFKQLTL